MRNSLLFLALLAIPLLSTAQPTHYSLSLTGGKTIPTQGSPFGGNSPTLGVDASIYWLQGDTSVYWQRFWRLPYFGIRGNYAHVINAIAGEKLELASIFQGQVYRGLDWVYSVGISYYTNPYSRSHDEKNSFIGSALNCLIDLGFLYNWDLTANTTLFLSGKLVHTSNGYLYKPNHGLNYLQAELGLRVGPTHPHLTLPGRDTNYHSFGRLFLSFAPGAVMSRNDPIDQIVFYPAYMFQLGYIRYPHPAFAYGAALDLSYNFAHRKLAPADEWPLYPALSAFGDCLWGPFVLRLGMAHYLAYYPQNWFQYYERVALYYRFGRDQRQHAGIGMKVHGDHIDFIEWTYGIEL